ncbi:MAG: low temperature requirement protein A [Oscillospiraceae bacterium]|nr:low temperature requirement protein A [Oscillospiraceae bacterium]
MEEHLTDKSEKKVEYLELIYDLIFVYLIGKNNALLHHMEGGFFSAATFFTYLLASLVILQIWYFSTLLINRYGSNGVSDHIGLFVNMYLLYYLANGIRRDWDEYYIPYNAAWGLILVNLAVQYWLRQRRSHGMTPWADRHMKYHMRLLLIQAAVVLGSIPVYLLLHIPLSWLSLLVGFAAAVLTSRVDALMPVNFEHLTERVMLYIVFSFGEMIIAIAEYFGDGFSGQTLYFSLMAFLIVTGLFLSYGFLYNHIIDRERSSTTGTQYMMIHIGLIVSLSCITAALEFMREPEVNEIAKNVFLVASFLAYYFFLFLVGTYAMPGFRADRRYIAVIAGAAAVFVVCMALSYRSGRASIAVSVLFVYAVFGMIVRRYRAVTRSAV